jgi:hypothetical protein
MVTLIRCPHRVFVRGATFTAFSMVLASAAVAQPGAPLRTPPVSGTTVALSGQTLKVSTPEHGEVSVTLSAQTRIIDQQTASLAQVKAGEFIGTTAVQGADGQLRATEIHIFPESMRGAGEGHYPMGSPSTTMTNGNVEAIAGSVTASAGAAGSERLRISYKGGQSRVEVPSNVSVTRMGAGSRRLLKPGARVTVLLAPGAHVGQDGLMAGTVIVREPGTR